MPGNEIERSSYHDAQRNSPAVFPSPFSKLQDRVIAVNVHGFNIILQILNGLLQFLNKENFKPSDERCGTSSCKG